MTKRELIKALEKYSNDAIIELSIPTDEDNIWFEIDAVEEYLPKCPDHRIIFKVTME